MKYDLRPYQIDCLNQLNEHFKTNNTTVLSICPGGGKTLVAANYAKNSGLKTLILAHGTSIIRTQWTQRLKQYGIRHSTDINSKSKIIVQLPQSLYDKDLPEFDLLIVDEAHEFYFADMVKTIIKKTKPKQSLLLTGTPSKFIKNGVPTIVVSADKLIQQNYMSDVYFGLATTNEPIKRVDFKTDGDLKQSVRFKKTNETLNELIKSIHTRIVGLNKFNPAIKNFDKITSGVFDKLDKTMIACNNIGQAEAVKSYFDKKGIKTLLSHSKNDYFSENIETFRSDNEIKILIVVDRGILGFDMPELVNVVDLTCSRNIDRIYQLYARVMRKSNKHNMKMFFKVIPENDMMLHKFYLQAALCMLREDFISKYNGKNLNGMEIPVLKSRSRKSKSDDSKSKTTKRPETYHPIDEYFYNEVSVAKLLDDIYNKHDRVLNEFAYATLGKIKEKNFGVQRRIVNITEENLLYIIKTGKVDERIYG